MHRQIAGKLTGRVTKWIVLGDLARRLRRPRFVLVQAGRRPEQRGFLLAAVQRRVDPGAREARAVPGPQRHPHRDRLREDFRPHRGRPRGGHRAGGRVPGDGRRRGRGRGPGPSSEDGQVAQTVVTFNFGKNGWEDMPDTADELRDIAAIDGVNTYIAGSGGQAADSFEAFAGIDSSLLAGGPRRGHHHPAVHLPQSRPVDPSDLLGRRQPGHEPGPGLLPRQVRRPHGQRPEPGDPEHPGDRRRHRLRAAARGEISRRAPSPRGPARGDGVRPAPGGAGDPRQRRRPSRSACSA